MLRRGPLYERGALSRQDDLKKVGINLKLALLDTAANSDRQRKSDFQAYTAPASVHMDEPDLYYARFTCDAPSNHGKYCNPELTNSLTSRVACSMSRNGQKLLGKWSASCSKIIPTTAAITGNRLWATRNQVRNWPPLLGTTAYNYGKFEQVWCQSGRCM